MKCFSILISIVVFLGCDNNQKKINEFIHYIENDLQEVYKEKDLYMLFPTTDACGTCIKRSREFLLALPGKHNNIHLVYIGTSRKELSFLSNDLENKYHVLYDTNNTAYKNKLVSFNSMILLPNRSGEFYEFSTVHNFEKMKNDVQKFIKENL